MPTLPKGVQEAAARALRWIKEGGVGKTFTDTGRTRCSVQASCLTQ